MPSVFSDACARKLQLLVGAAFVYVAASSCGGMSHSTAAGGATGAAAAPAAAAATAEAAAYSQGATWEANWQEVQRVQSPRYSDAAHQFSTFRSAPISLDIGRVVLTPPKKTPLKMPPEPLVVTSLQLEVVRAADGAPVPLTEVYNHHVVFYAGGDKIGADVCGGAHLDMLDGLWATGAEARHTVTEFPEGVALTGKGPWYTNIHLIRSQGVPSVKRCIECACDTWGGSEDCCGDGSICPGFPHGTASRNGSDVKQYAVQYTVGWSANVKNYQLAHYMTLDATGCQLEFQVPVQCPWMWRHDALKGGLVPGAKGLRGSGRDLPSDFEVAVLPPQPKCVASVSWDYELPSGAAGRVVFSKGHVHIGGLNLTLQVIRNNVPEPDFLCAMSARYGKSDPGTANHTGDERGYITGVSTCLFHDANTRPTLKKGDVLRVTATYRTDLWFNGVMGLADLAVLPDEVQEKDDDGLLV